MTEQSGRASLQEMRTDYCGHLNIRHVGEQVALCGWVHRRRDHGGLIFLDLRDREGIAQVVFDPSTPKSFSLADSVRNEFVIHVEGKVRPRPAGSTNASLSTGEIEVLGSRLVILNTSLTPPFQLDEYSEAGEDVRLRYRYIDLRHPQMLNRLKVRSQVTGCVRKYMEQEGFLDIETPILAPSTPEGARDYLVPSRVSPGRFYALPQSPQLFKQFLMMSGVDRYYQLARCFRDEDLRADRQPEFTQIDIEASFVSSEDVMSLTEGMLSRVFREVLNEEPPLFERMTWAKALEDYGTDKPDLTNPLVLVEIADLVKDVDFKVFQQPAQDANGRVVALKVPAGSLSLARKNIDDYTEFVGRHGAKGLAYIRVRDMAAGVNGLQSPILKFIADHVVTAIMQRLKARSGDLIFFGAGHRKMVNASMGALRSRVAEDLGLSTGGYRFCWITDFPMFERDAEGRLRATHHPFTRPACSLEEFRADPESVGSMAYDITLNGYELGGGSLRIHEVELQGAVLEVLGNRATDEFGFLLDALRRGCPPHGGIALGLDRLVMLLMGAQSIRDVIAFPKTQSAADLLFASPGEVDFQQLQDLNIGSPIAELSKDSAVAESSQHKS